MAFRIWSESFRDGETLPPAQLFNGMGQAGDNRSPSVYWENAPEGTKSFALTFYDPDAPTGSGWWHWVVINIPAEVSMLPEGASSESGGLPAGARQVRNDFGIEQYGGAAPPPGRRHRYILTVHALDVEDLGAPENASPAMVGFLIHQHVLASASITAFFR